MRKIKYSCNCGSIPGANLVMFMRLYCLKCRSRPCVYYGWCCWGWSVVLIIWHGQVLQGCRAWCAHRSHMPTCTDAVVTPTISCTSPKTSCKAQHTCVANNKATGGSSLSNGDGQDTNAKSTKPHAGKDRRTRSRTGHGARQICKHASQAMCRAGLIR